MNREKGHDLTPVWQVIEAKMHEEHTGSEHSFELWFGRMELRSLTSKEAVFVVENATKCNVIREKYIDLIESATSDVMGYDIDVRIEVDASLAPIVPDDGTVISPLKIVRERQKQKEELAKQKEENLRIMRELEPPDEEDFKEFLRNYPDDEFDDENPELLAELRAKTREAIQSSVFLNRKLKALETIRAEEAEEDEDEYEEEAPAADKSKEESRGERRVTYNPDYTFENFIVGSSNKFAHAAALNVADNVGMNINPLFIWGPSGLGKTHLMYAIANRALQRRPGMKVIYVKGEEFMNQLIESIAMGKTREFRQKYRNTDMLLIDDIQFIAGKEATQTEFFHTFDALYEDRRQIIITSDRPPKELTSLEDRIRSRFEAGLLADIQPPDYELRLAILRKKIDQNNVVVPIEVIDFLAQNLQENIRQLEGVIKKLAMSHLLTGHPINMEMVLGTVPEYLRDVEPVSDTIGRIVSCVARRYSVTEEEIMGTLRKKNIKNARNVAMYVVRMITNMSLPQIGTYFNRDHSTVHSNINAVAEEAAGDPVFDAQINDIIREVKQGG